MTEEKSKIAYYWCEHCDWNHQLHLPVSVERINKFMTDCTDEHTATKCPHLLIFAGKPKNGT